MQVMARDDKHTPSHCEQALHRMLQSTLPSTLRTWLAVPESECPLMQRCAVHAHLAYLHSNATALALTSDTGNPKRQSTIATTTP